LLLDATSNNRNADFVAGRVTRRNEAGAYLSIVTEKNRSQLDKGPKANGTLQASWRIVEYHGAKYCLR